MEKWAAEVGLTPDMVKTLIEWGTKVLGVIVILFAAFVIAGWVKSALVRRLTKVGFDATLTKFLGSMSRWAIVLFAILGCLGMFGIETTSFAAVIGGASLAVGLAFQGSLSNVAAGAMLLLFRPYKVGDVITAAGKTGKVDTIDLFMTTLDTPDNKRIMIPNGSVFGNVIENITFHDTRRADVVVGVDYDASIDETRKILLAAAKKVDTALEEPAPVAVLTGLGGSSVDWQLRIWTKTEDYAATLESGTRAVKLELDEAGIGIPYPHQVSIIQKQD